MVFVYKNLARVISNEVLSELRTATKKYGSFKNAHEGYAILLEEKDELWTAIKLNPKKPERLTRIRKEAIQVSAMAIRIILDCCENKI